MKKPFNADQFTPTKWEGAEQKAKFANHFVRFVESGFKPALFYDWFYKRLSMTFGHIAHYDRGGFYSTWFSTDERRRQFLERTSGCGGHGDPTFTYCDVERALRAWVAGSGLIEKLDAAIAAWVERKEREQLAKLKAKYEQTA